MFRYAIKRILFVVPVFIAVAFISFAIVALYPGDFFTPTLMGAALAGHDPHAVHRALQIQAGIDKPFIVQFFIYLKGIVTRFDFGTSFVGPSVSKILFSPSSGLYWTLLITGLAMFLAWLFGIPLGIIAALRNRKWEDLLITGTVYVGISFPPFTLGWLFFYIMYKWINPLIINAGVWGPVDYKLVNAPMSATKLGSYAVHLIPIVLIAAAPMLANVTRYMKLELQDTLPSLYLQTARSKGVSELRVILRHAFRNALNPLVSLFGIMLPSLLTGTIIAGQILGYPEFGGTFLVRAIERQDQHVITAALLFYCCFLIVGNLIADLLLVVLDPRIRYE